MLIFFGLNMTLVHLAMKQSEIHFKLYHLLGWGGVETFMMGKCNITVSSHLCWQLEPILHFDSCLFSLIFVISSHATVFRLHIKMNSTYYRAPVRIVSCQQAEVDWRKLNRELGFLRMQEPSHVQFQVYYKTALMDTWTVLVHTQVNSAMWHMMRSSSLIAPTCIRNWVHVVHLYLTSYRSGYMHQILSLCRNCYFHFLTRNTAPFTSVLRIITYYLCTTWNYSRMFSSHSTDQWVQNKNKKYTFTPITKWSKKPALIQYTEFTHN
jgi:hypothetical protein